MSSKWLLGWVVALALASSSLAAPRVFPPAQQEYWAEIDEHDWAGAITAAEKLVEAARGTATTDPMRLAEALTLLGSAQLGSKNLPGAEAAYAESLQITEPRVSATSEKLLEPVRGLGYTLAAGGKHSQAIPLLQKALVISRRNAGLFNPGQQGLLRQLANSLTAIDDAGEAQRHILYLLRIGERSYGARDLRMAPLLCIVGDWYTSLGVMAPARESYRSALSIAEEKGGKDTLALVPPLRSLAASYRRELFLAGAGMLRYPETEPVSSEAMTRDVRPITPQYLNAEGERALLRAVKVVESHTSEADNIELTKLTIDTLVDAGDWYQVRSQPQKALPFYRRAAALIPAAGARIPEASGPFAFPVQVYLPIPMLATRNRYRPGTEVEERFVQVEFTVSSTGEVKSEHVVDQDATSRQVSETLSAIHAARYRPKFVNGEPVETTAVSYRQIFRQRKDKDAEPDKPS